MEYSSIFSIPKIVIMVKLGQQGFILKILIFNAKYNLLTEATCRG